MRRGDIYWYEHPEAGRRPWLILTRTEAVPVLNQVMGVPATRTARHIPTEVDLDEDDGMPAPCVLVLDNVAPIRRSLCTSLLTTLGPQKMASVCKALGIATGCA
ncbi:MAG: type II toxin-antitoxin system PemK/MazF family toxin [Acidimicrobiales bacterium]